MYYEIWIDVLFVMNAWIDFLLLRLINRILRGSATPGRSMAGACIGALGVCLLACFPAAPIVNTILVHVALNTIMVRFGCNLKQVKNMLAGVLLLYGTAFLMGGFLQMIRRYTGTNSIKILLLAGLAGYGVFSAGMEIYARYIAHKNRIYKVWLYANGKCKEAAALLDTGNHLRDPINGKPICIVEITMLEELYSAKTMEQLRHFHDGWELQEEIRKMRPHFVPFTSLGCSDGMALAVTIDYLCLEGQRIQKVIPRPVIAFSRENSSLSKDYQVILHPNLIDS